MRESSPRGWHRCRVAVVKSASSVPAFDPMSRLTAPVVGSEPVRSPAEEVRGTDGIRHELVARVRQQIAEGTYDTDEKWLAAEEALLRRVGCL